VKNKQPSIRFVDLFTVNENAADPPMESSDKDKESINSPSALAIEAALINHCFAVQALNEVLNAALLNL
jgi:translation initiation factor 3 subunit D